MNFKQSFFLTIALLAVTISSTSFQATPCYAVGDIHIIIVRSTTDPGLSEGGKIWKERLEETLATGMTGKYKEFGAFGALESATNPGGLGRNDVKTYKVLEGENADPENIIKCCRETSKNAGADDAIAVFIMSHGATVTGADGVHRHAFAPVAETPGALDLVKKGIQRGTILNCLTKEKQHRLVMLVSDSCARPASENPARIVPQDRQLKGKAPVPKETSYLKKFLQEARGVVNINSCDEGQSAMLITRCPLPEFQGGLFVNAFSRFASNGFYLESELNPDDFYKLLRIEHAREAMLYLAKRSKNRQDVLTQYNGSVHIPPSMIPYHSLDSFDKYYEDRKEKMINSGEFKVEERTYIQMTTRVVN